MFSEIITRVLGGFLIEIATILSGWSAYELIRHLHRISKRLERREERLITLEREQIAHEKRK
jgi:hypothetical protein